MNLADAKEILQTNGISIVKHMIQANGFARTDPPRDLDTVKQQVEAIGYVLNAFVESTDNCLQDA